LTELRHGLLQHDNLEKTDDQDNRQQILKALAQRAEELEQQLGHGSRGGYRLAALADHLHDARVGGNIGRSGRKIVNHRRIPFQATS
jgi:hypothetical protein